MPQGAAMSPALTPQAPARHRPLLITENSRLIDDVLNLAAAVGADLHVASHASRSLWAASPLVLVGPDALAGLVRRPLERRRDVVVVLVGDQEGDDPAGLATSPEPWRDAVAIGAEHVIMLPEAQRWLGDRLSSAAEGPRRDGTVVAITGACGGAGASTLAGAMALAARRAGRAVLLIDGDPLGGGLDVALGCEALPGARWSDLADGEGRLSAASLDAALPHPHGIAMLSHGRQGATAPRTELMTTVLDAGVRGYDLVLLDQPRTALLDDSIDVRQVFLVVPNRIRGIAAAAVALPRLDALASDVHLVLRRSARGVATRDVERALAATIAGEIADDPRAAAAAEAGALPADAYVRSAGRLLERSGALALAEASVEPVA